MCSYGTRKFLFLLCLSSNGYLQSIHLKLTGELSPILFVPPPNSNLTTNGEYLVPKSSVNSAYASLTENAGWYGLDGELPVLRGFSCSNVDRLLLL